MIETLEIVFVLPIIALSFVGWTGKPKALYRPQLIVAGAVYAILYFATFHFWLKSL